MGTTGGGLATTLAILHKPTIFGVWLSSNDACNYGNDTIQYTFLELLTGFATAK